MKKSVEIDRRNRCRYDKQAPSPSERVYYEFAIGCEVENCYDVFEPGVDRPHSENSHPRAKGGPCASFEDATARFDGQTNAVIFGH